MTCDRCGVGLSSPLRVRCDACIATAARKAAVYLAELEAARAPRMRQADRVLHAIGLPIRPVPVLTGHQALAELRRRVGADEAQAAARPILASIWKWKEWKAQQLASFAPPPEMLNRWRLWNRG